MTAIAVPRRKSNLRALRELEAYRIRVVENSPQTISATDTIDDGNGTFKPGSLIAVPDWKEWEIMHLRAEWTASAVAGTRQPVLMIRSPTMQQPISRVFGNAGASQTITVEWGSVSRATRGGASEGESFVLNEAIGSPAIRSSSQLWKLTLPARFQIAFFDAASIAQANTVIIRAFVKEYDRQ